MSQQKRDVHTPVLPDAQMNIVTVKSPVIGRCVSNDPCTNGKSASFVRHTVIDVSGTPLVGACLPGQAFGVIAPGVDKNGNPDKVRLFSIANGSAGENRNPAHIATTPKRLIDEYKPQKHGDDLTRRSLFAGVCSNYLCDLQPGDEVQLTGANGKRFLLPVQHDAHDYIFVATGTGIAPFRGFVMDLLCDRATPCSSQIHLVMGSPYTSDLLYDDLFRSLAAKNPNFHYHTAISREPYEGRARGPYTHDYIDDNIETFGPILANPRTLIYLCGVLGMQYGMYKLLAKHGVDAGYQTEKDELTGVEWEVWNEQQMRRYIRPTPRMMVEVY